MTKKRYLVYVEDDEDDLLLVEEIMDTCQTASLVTLKDGQELMDFLEDQRDGELPFMVIMDNNTPRLSGLEAASAIKQDEDFKTMTLIILTTSASRSLKDQLGENNIEVFTKPSTFPEWQQLFNKFLKDCA
jgi:CheY-like chemotaxis protein